MKLNEHKKYLLLSTVTVAVLFVLSLLLAYFTTSRDPVTVFFKRLYPSAFIGARVISINDIQQAQALGMSFGMTKSEATDSFLDGEKSAALADKLNIRIDSNFAANEMRFYTKGNEAEYDRLLDEKFGGSDHWFYKYIVNPQVIDAGLRMKYYNDTRATSPAYKKAQATLERLSKGERFEDLARTESDDKITAQIGGDLGFYESGQMLPELEDQVSVSALGEVRKDVITSRLGYHIIYPVEQSESNGKKTWHVKHILFVPEGYDQWLDQQISGINVAYLKRY